LPGEREIRDTHLALARRKYRSTEILALYARLSAKEQDRVFNPGTGRRIVLATNVAETSLTVPRIRYVVDPGLARVNRFSHRNKVQRLHVEPISQASAEQRKGRCGRVGPGICYRLYDEADFLARPRYTEPELLRSSLAGVILRLMSLKLGPIEEFPFLDPPNERLIADGYQTLLELDAITPDRRALTAIGRELARLPIDVKLGRMLIEAQRRGCAREMLVIAAFLSIQDPRERPADARQAADLAHAPFADTRSDFVGVLKLWEAYRVAHEELTQSKLRDWCETHFLSFLRMREWRELHRQLLVLGEERETSADRSSVGGALAPTKSAPKNRDRAIPVASDALGLRASGPRPLLQEPTGSAKDDAVTAQQYESIHRALLSGFPGQVGRRDEKGQYQGTRGRRYSIFPGSGLAKSQPAWLLSAIYLDTARLYGLMNARVEPLWVEQQAAHLVKKRWFDPHWSRKDGRVMAYEQVTLFGLTLVEKRRVNFERIDPVEARRVFIRAALVTGDIDAKAAFVRDNMAVLAAARDEEAKRRRRGLVADDETLAQWLEPRIPDGIASAAGLDAWWKALSPEAKKALVWTLADVLDTEAGGEAQFPEKLDVLGRRLALEYRFEPGHAADGVTLKLPLELLNAVPSARLGWLVPGFRVELVAELIRGLPKPLRRNFVPAPDFARAFVNAVAPDDGTIVAALSRWLARTTGVEVPPEAWAVADLPPHLRMNVRLLDERRAPLAEGRDLDAL
ncbi:MAG TPA: DUF3418 domain-containing protein, partial [Xanthomonadales bacterium]|nr:DUF3418 domain-containing protein [Xanthomonadales bacterium]